MRPASLPHLAAALALLVATIQDPGWDLTAPRPVDGDVPVRADTRDALDCARCHREVAEEWTTTLHAFAWIDPFYTEEQKDRRKPESCHGCHAPRPIHLTGLGRKPTPRDDARALGVTCVSCHRGPDETILGPRGTPTEAHPSVASAAFTPAGSIALCATCHDTDVGPVIGIAKGFATSPRARGGATCLSCHMAAVERRWANAPDGGDGDAPARAGRSHALQTPRDPTFLRRALALSARVEDGVTILEIANAAGHQVPGLIGRALVLDVELQDDAGATLARHRLVIDTDAPLTTARPLEVELAGAGAALRVKGVHRDPRTRADVPFLDERIEPAR